jgi:type IV pilus assembly protein PilC
MEFVYQARDRDGALKTGTVEATSQTNAFDVLQSHGLIVVKILPANKVSIFESIIPFDRISFKDLVIFSRQMATLIDAKVPIIQSLKIMRAQVSSHKFQNIISEIAERVESGDSLSSAMASYPKVFSTLYINLIKAGELSGALDDSLNYLANQLEKDYDLRSKIITSLTYPAFIIMAVLIVGALMFIYVLPPLVAILQQSAVDLPVATKILIGVTNFLNNFWWVILILVVGSVLGIRYYKKTVNGRYFFDYMKLKIPFIGKLYQSIYMTRYSRNLATLVAGGIPIVKALDSVAEIVGNQIYKDIFLEASKQVRSGKTIAATLENQKEIPALVIQMTQIGETTGKFQEIMAKMAGFYEKEVDGLLRIFTTLIEPLIMILLGVAVAIIVAGILLPIYNLASVS